MIKRLRVSVLSIESLGVKHLAGLRMGKPGQVSVLSIESLGVKQVFSAMLKAIWKVSVLSIESLGVKLFIILGKSLELGRFSTLHRVVGGETLA